MPRKATSPPNVSPTLSTLDERVRADRLREMMRINSFTTSIIGEIVRWDEIRSFRSIAAILDGAYHKNVTSKNRDLGARAVARDFTLYHSRAAVDLGYLRALEDDIGSVHVEQPAILERTSPTYLGKSIVVRHTDLNSLLTGTPAFNPVADRLHRGSSFTTPSVNADPYTTSQTDMMRTHIADIIGGLSVPEITTYMGEATDIQSKRLAYWGGVVASLQYPGEHS
jgi:hypothetical protein